MARHYYEIELHSDGFLDDEDIAELESAISESIKILVGEYPRVITEYIDSDPS